MSDLAPGARLARALLVPFPLAAVLYLAAVRWKLTPARPELAWSLAVFPLAALAVGVCVRARASVLGALAELASAALLHQLLTFIRAWRLE